jgi:CRP-like cAMP-binding protein
VDELLRLLRATWLFARIEPDTAEELGKRLQRKRFRRGQPLFHQGDRADALYILVEGSVAIVMSSESGDRMVLNALHAPDVFGEISLLDGGVRSAGTEAVDDVTVLMLSRKAFLELIREHPKLVDLILRALGALVRRLSEQASDFVFLDLPGRLAKVLLHLAAYVDHEVHGVPIELNITQKQLAEMAGGTRQSVNQVLQGWAQRGIVEVQARRVLVFDPEALRQRAGQ